MIRHEWKKDHKIGWKAWCGRVIPGETVPLATSHTTCRQCLDRFQQQLEWRMQTTEMTIELIEKIRRNLDSRDPL